MATIILTSQMILDYAEKNPKANATDILKHFNSLKDKYVNRNGDPLKRGSIQNILSNTFDLAPTVPKGYQKASEIFMIFSLDALSNPFEAINISFESPRFSAILIFLRVSFEAKRDNKLLEIRI